MCRSHFTVASPDVLHPCVLKGNPLVLLIFTHLFEHLSSFFLPVPILFAIVVRR